MRNKHFVNPKLGKKSLFFFSKAFKDINRTIERIYHA